MSFLFSLMLLTLCPIHAVLSSNHFIRSDDEGRVDNSARGFWQRGDKAFFDVRIFNPFAKSHLPVKLKTLFAAQETAKKRTVRSPLHPGCFVNEGMAVEKQAVSYPDRLRSLLKSRAHRENALLENIFLFMYTLQH